MRRRYLVIGAWLALLIALGGALGTAGAAFSDSTRLPSSDSASAYALLTRGAAAGSGTSGTIVWHGDSGSAVGGPARARIQPMLTKVSHLSGVAKVTSPFTGAGGAGQVSDDGRTAYATVSFSDKANAGQAQSLAEHAGTSTLKVQTGGKAFTNQIPSESSEIIGAIAALVILLLVFRAPWAAALPILTGVAGVAISSLAVMLLSHVLTLSSISLSMSALIGLGVGIDYALFIVNRQRKALRAGADVAGATATAMNTSGRAVLFAGATVIVALLGMLVLGVGFLTGIAVAAAVTVACTVAAAATLLPALLGVTGRRVLRKRERTALMPDATAGDGEARGGWSRWSAAVQRRPRLAVVVAGVMLVVLALPALGLRLGTSDASSDPAGTSTRSYYDTMASGFGRGFDAQLVVVADVPDAPAHTSWTRLVAELPALPDVASVGAPIDLGSDVSMVTVTPASPSQATATADLVSRLRSDVIARAEAGTALKVHVGGPTATSIDFADALTAKLPLFLAIIAVLGFVLLMVAFRSLLLPLIGALGNLLTIAVALGVTVALFQWGWGPSLFGVGGAAPVEYIVTMLVVGVMFGLSMDYHVFLVSRMHEEWTATGDHRRAVGVGLADTGRVIATAAAIMGCVFASFGFAGMRTASEFGVALAAGVLADAFLLRLTVIPALLHLVGRRAWALPRALDKVLPHVSVEEMPDTVAAPDRAVSPEPAMTH